MTAPGTSPSWSGPRGQTIDPLPIGGGGRYADDAVVVERADRASGDLTSGRADRVSARTRHFLVDSHGGRLHLVHTLRPADLDDDLAGLLERELFASGWVSGAGTFERLLTGIVVSAGADAWEGWDAFYANSLAVLSGQCAPRPGGTLAEFVDVHARAVTEIGTGTVLDLGSCFGFLPLQLAARPGVHVVASDISDGSMRLLGAVAARRGTPIATLTCDAAIVPRPDRAVDTVAAVHLLEHLDDGHGRRALAEAQRLARRRVVVAVPYEPIANAAFGHVRTFDAADLTALGDASGWAWRVFDDAGGWLVLDRPGASDRSGSTRVR